MAHTKTAAKESAELCGPSGRSKARRARWRRSGGQILGQDDAPGPG